MTVEKPIGLIRCPNGQLLTPIYEEGEARLLGFMCSMCAQIDLKKVVITKLKTTKMIADPKNRGVLIQAEIIENNYSVICPIVAGLDVQ